MTGGLGVKQCTDGLSGTQIECDGLWLLSAQAMNEILTAISDTGDGGGHKTYIGGPQLRL